MAYPNQRFPEPQAYNPPNPYTTINGNGGSEYAPRQVQAQGYGTPASYSYEQQPESLQLHQQELQPGHGSPQNSVSSHQTAVNADDEELTEEEREAYEAGVLTWSKCKNWRFWIRKEWIWYYVGFVLLVVLVALMAFFHSSVSRKYTSSKSDAGRCMVEQ